MAGKKKNTTRKLLPKKKLNVCNVNDDTDTTSVSSMDTNDHNTSSDISISEFICPESPLVEEIADIAKPKESETIYAVDKNMAKVLINEDALFSAK